MHGATIKITKPGLSYDRYLPLFLHQSLSAVLRKDTNRVAKSATRKYRTRTHTHSTEINCRQTYFAHFISITQRPEYCNLFIFIETVYVSLLLFIYPYCCLCILIVVYVFLLYVHVFLTLSMYSYCCLCILVVYVFLLLSMFSYCTSMYS